MSSQPQCRLLHDLPELSLSLIWQHVCKLPMANRRALLATCKRALSTFGSLVDRMARLELTMKQIPTKAAAEVSTGLPCSNAPRAPEQQRGSFSASQLVLSCFQQAKLEHLDLHFRDSPGLMLSPALAAFFLNSRGALEHVTCLGMNCKEVSQLSFRGEIAVYHFARFGCWSVR